MKKGERLIWLLSGILVGVLVSFVGLFFYERLFTNRPAVLAVQTIGNYTVRIHGEKSWDNWCFVKYIDVTDSKQNGALTSIPVDTFYSEHCPNTEKTPWVVTASQNSEPRPDFKVLTGVINGTTYSRYRFSDATSRYELTREQ